MGLDRYLGRFPELTDTPDGLAAILESEIRIRREADRAPDPAEYEARYSPLELPIREIFRRAGAAMPSVPGLEVLGELGRGGMDVVYHARQLALRREVALKVIRRDRLAADADSDRHRARFWREAVAAINHPGVVQLYEAGDVDGDFYFTMELVRGPSLKQNLANEGPLTPRVAAPLVEQVARAVAAVHARGVVHRDLTPGNILLGPDGAKVANFGLARLAEAATGSGERLGTPGYLSHEQAAGRSSEVTPAADVQGLGAVLYAALTGRPPFQGATPIDALRQVLDDKPVDPARLNGSVPSDLATVCLRCLAKEPSRCYPTVQALGDDLRRHLEGRPIQARRAGLAERGRLWAWRIHWSRLSVWQPPWPP